MAAMTTVQIESCYHAAVDVFNGKETVSESAKRVSRTTGLNVASAQMYIHAVLSMLKGTAFGMNINEESIDYYLRKIREDYGEQAQKRAAKAILLKFLEDIRKNKYLRGAMSVLSHEEMQQLLREYEAGDGELPIG